MDTKSTLDLLCMKKQKLETEQHGEHATICVDKKKKLYICL